MKLKTKNKVRELWTKRFMDFLVSEEEEVGQIASNCVNFPIEYEGEEAWIEVLVKIPNDDEGYEKREEYADKVKRDIEIEKKRAEEKAKKIARDKKRREEIKAKKEAEAKKKEKKEE